MSPAPRSVKDSSDHIAIHAQLESDMENLKQNLARSFDDLNGKLNEVNVMVKEVRDEMIKVNANLAHIPDENDVSKMFEVHRNELHTKPSIIPRQPIDWKAFGIMISVIIGSISALVIAILKIFVN